MSGHTLAFLFHFFASAAVWVNFGGSWAVINTKTPSCGHEEKKRKTPEALCHKGFHMVAETGFEPATSGL